MLGFLVWEREDAPGKDVITLKGLASVRAKRGALVSCKSQSSGPEGTSTAHVKDRVYCPACTASFISKDMKTTPSLSMEMCSHFFIGSNNIRLFTAIGLCNDAEHGVDGMN